MQQEDREYRVRERAQQIWENEGREEGNHERHWSQAEREIELEQQTQSGRTR